MKILSGYFNRVCAQKYQPLGFYRSKSIFVRISGDALQAFTLKCSRDVSTCSVEFGIFPLCLPQPIFLDAGGYMLDEFTAELPDGSSGWTFDPGSKESMINCIRSISEAIDLYLLPFFERCSDCKSALSELVKLEELFDRNRQIRLRLRGDFDSAAPWQERALFDSRKYYMAMKSHDLPYARQYLNHQVDFCKTKLESFDKPNSPRQPDVVRQRFLAQLSMCAEHLKWLESEDWSCFDDLVGYNEHQMRKYLADKYPAMIRKQ